MSEWRFKLLYDGECPFCRREVRWLGRWNRRGYLAFEDVTSPSFEPSLYGKTREELLGVIHGVFPDGRVGCKVEANHATSLEAAAARSLVSGRQWRGAREAGR